MNGEVTDAGGSVRYVNNIEGTVPALTAFSQVVWAGPTAYLAGQLGLDPATKQLVEGGIVPETETLFANLRQTLEGIGLGFKDVAKVSVYLTDMADFAIMNEIYCRHMGKCRAARETVAVKALARNAKIEITMTAYRGE